MFKENDVVVVKRNHPEKGVHAGQIGTVIYCFTEPNEAYEVEVANDSSQLVAQLTLLPSDLELYKSH